MKVVKIKKAKKLMAAFCALAMAVSMSAVQLKDAGVSFAGVIATSAETYKNFEYYEENARIVISGYNGNEATVTVPSQIDGMDVIKISNYVFSEKTNLKKINLPDTLESIGDYAFYGCTSLTSIDLPDSVTQLGWRTFYNCTALTSINYPVSLEDTGYGVFEGCDKHIDKDRQQCFLGR